jgi:hypothetical protein
MSALPHLATVGALLSTHSVPHLRTSLLSGLSMVGVFALLLGAGYLLLAHRWPGRSKHLHR